ncbi:hypothetical protein A2422_03965 [Candidatus Woesebacteria bacterium RIFOXYC1_FULL_31_51]|uniref:Uncharacterized protein n=1 Tax=Candidatus Woesebacteria bacterium GW2011_GWC2_31_9 TaxID=1618586 RepID=A0A0F9Z040_9BACT|nr:MAG: hypothetical protein UR17_C0001G0310 [Candidatus Woesebacteria bacterium GW2011_GWF1_31_35]KKP23196.1 MAG: hypothetical protein UR11_C0001G0170 [Candidatus Woesebacteria bacterium GW2011_GWC1_30_29]KKP26884.1 MAG: hypothetical protein UR13_C0002G0119 [Candidatus Woesebacteria bacterium GW2011_GWD1_31_12]KKP27458.1 MAG: hypothetical protein UR16_C0003G0118 [Candidatus Woesebacteria bacterium GW2011_GWB1_31_29]KKP31065.1 MAG: hypothetical protein UR20_C0044G0003 [Candidatus Woesebacteria 
MPLKLISNKGKLSSLGVGSISYHLGKIHINLENYCQAILLRDGNNIKLLETNSIGSSITGIPKEGDVYTLGSIENFKNNESLEILTVKVEKQNFSIPLPKFPRQNFFVNNNNSNNEATPQARKTTLTVGVVLLILLLVSVFFGVRQKRLNEFQEKSKVLLTQALSDYENSINSISIDKDKSRELFISSKEIAFKLEKDGFKSDDLKKLIEKITSQEGEILGEIKATVNEFLDLTLQTSGFNGDEIASSGEEVFVIDKKNKNIIQIGIKTKNATIVAGSGEVGETTQIGAYEERLFLLKNDGIYEVNNTSKKVLEKDWSDVLFYLYAGNIYLIDKTNNTILRYAGSLNSFSAKSDWLAPGIEADFSKVKDISIDGAIWLLSSSGKVAKFILGSPQAISLKGLIGQLDNPTAIYTNENLKMVYILEKDKGRIVVIEKKGDFKIQYTSDDIKNAKDLVVSETEGKIILLTGPKLMFIELK